MSSFVYGYGNDKIRHISESEMNQVETDVVFYINYVRTNPKEFNEKFVKNNPNFKKDKYYKSLVVMLDSIKPMEELKIDGYLNGTSLNHAKDMGKHGITNHYYSDGTLITDMFDVTECCNFGCDNGLTIVLSQLIDSGVSDYGHRLAILDKNSTKIGVSFRKHKSDFKVCTVIHFQ